MSYLRFALMILTSTVVMFGLMYLNTYAWEHVFFSETRAYMAVLMGSAMAVVMLAFMLGMYRDARLNAAIFAGAALVFAISLWLVRSQATVSGESYLRAMIPHHSIAILTSERAQIEDPRQRALADEIIAAQRREIAEMRHLVGMAGDGAGQVYRDPPAQPGSIADALANTLVATLDLAPLTRAESEGLLPPGARCTFSRSAGSDPVLWVAPDAGQAAVKLNGVLVTLVEEAGPGGAAAFAAPGARLLVRSLAPRRGGGQAADLLLRLDPPGFEVGYRGRSTCAP